MAAFTKLKYIFNSRKINIETKIRTMDCYVKSIFLYNCEIWTTTKEIEKIIDVFQRNLLRRILHIYWRDKVSNERLYERSKTKPWSRVVKYRRLSWLGHLLRLHEETPAKQALREHLRPVKRPRGKPKTTWISVVNKDLEIVQNNMKINSETLEHYSKLAENRKEWSAMIGRAMSAGDGGVQN